jgi:protocatechuate 3,4-dioxygenase beta subunit
VGTSNSGRWFVVAALLVSASAACSWLFLAASSDAPAPGAPPSTDAATADAKRGATRRSAAESGTKSDASKPVVEIDDAPMPEDATFVVRGSVADASGAPIEGAHVDFSTWRRDVYGDESHGAKTGADGSYVVEDLDAHCIWHAQASAVDFASSASANAVLATSKRREIRRDFVLARCGALEVVVLDDRGAPIAHRTWIRSTDPDRSGFDVRPDVVEPGRYRVFVSATDRAAEVRDVDVADGAATRVEFRLGAAVEIAGVLVDSDGQPMEGYDVVAFAADETPPYSDHRAKTARDGSFTIRGLRRARYEVRLDAVGADRVDFTADGGERVDAPADAVRLTARAPATVRFHLVYPPGFTASQKAADVDVFENVRSRHDRVSARWDYDRGAVQIPGGADVELVIDVPDCLRFRRRVSLRPGDDFDSGDVALVPASEISGRVVDAKGAGVRNANVVARIGGDSSVGGGDADGWFRLGRLPPGEIVVVASCAGFADSTVRCTSGQTAPVVVTLRPGGRLRVHADAASGAPLLGAALRIAPTDAAAAPATPDASALDAFGEFAIRVAAGRWRVDVAGCAPVDAEVREGAATLVTVRAAAR